MIDFSSMPPHKLVRRFWCPRCGAGPGDPCIGYEGYQRKAHHIQRVDKTRRVVGF